MVCGCRHNLMCMCVHVFIAYRFAYQFHSTHPFLLKYILPLSILIGNIILTTFDLTRNKITVKPLLIIERKKKKSADVIVWFRFLRRQWN